jgi:hypothetical protein
MQLASGGSFRRVAGRCVGAFAGYFGLGVIDAAASVEGAGARVPSSAVKAASSPLSWWKTTDLCREWRASCARLRRPISAAELEGIAEERRLCLEELQRRDADAFDRWLADRHPADDPTPFFRHPSRR